MTKIIISQILVMAILEMATDRESLPIFLGGIYFRVLKGPGYPKELPHGGLGVEGVHN